MEKSVLPTGVKLNLCMYYVVYLLALFFLYFFFIKGVLQQIQATKIFSRKDWLICFLTTFSEVSTALKKLTYF